MATTTAILDMATPTPFLLAQPPLPRAPIKQQYVFDRYNFIVAPVTGGNNGPNGLPGSGANSAGAPIPTCTASVVVGPLTSAGSNALLFKPVEPIFG